MARALAVDDGDVACQPLGGGGATRVFLVHAPGGQVILKLFDNAAWLAREPDIAAREVLATSWARERGLPAPKVLAADPDGRAAGLPAVLFERMPGGVELTPADPTGWLDDLARTLARVHHTAPCAELPTYRSWRPAAPEVPAWSREIAAWRRALTITAERSPGFTPRFLHRDYHAGNILWRGGAVSAVLDWTNGCTGPAWADVGHCRVNLVATHGIAAADRFLTTYRSHAPDGDYDPWWDLAGLVEWLPADAVYPGWAACGLRVDARAMHESLDAFVVNLVAAHAR